MSRAFQSKKCSQINAHYASYVTLAPASYCELGLTLPSSYHISTQHRMAVIQLHMFPPSPSLPPLSPLSPTLSLLLRVSPTPLFPLSLPLSQSLSYCVFLTSSLPSLSPTLFLLLHVSHPLSSLSLSLLLRVSHPPLSLIACFSPPLFPLSLSLRVSHPPLSLIACFSPPLFPSLSCVSLPLSLPLTVSPRNIRWRLSSCTSTCECSVTVLSIPPAGAAPTSTQ